MLIQAVVLDISDVKREEMLTNHVYNIQYYGV